MSGNVFKLELMTMGIDHEWLSILCCPETKLPLNIADDSVILKVNQAVSRGILVNMGHKLVSDPIEGGLIRSDKQILYPIRENIPVLLMEEGISLEELG